MGCGLLSARTFHSQLARKKIFTDRVNGLHSASAQETTARNHRTPVAGV